MLLPKKVGSFTLMRKLDTDGLAESFVAILDDPAGKQVVARRILPAIAREPGRVAQLRARVGDLRAARHSTLVTVLDVIEADGDLYVLEDWAEGVELRAVIDAAIAQRTSVPHNVYLNLATQVCNALEALHGRPGTESGAENVLHLALNPSAIWVTADGRITVGHYGLARSPTAIATASTGALPPGVEYLAPEQTHQDQKLTPASDIFALGAILYELLTLKPMFRADTGLQTIHRVRRAEVTTQLLEVKEIMPGLDKVLFRALSLNPRHRYQRAFVLREDLRGLMAGYSFNDIDTVTRAFLTPVVRAKPDGKADLVPAYATESQGDTTGFLLGRSVPDSRHALDVFPTIHPPDEQPEPTDALLADPDTDFGHVKDRTTAGKDRTRLPDPEEIDTARSIREHLAAGTRTAPHEKTSWVPQKPGSDGRSPALDGPKRPLQPVDTGYAPAMASLSDAPARPPLNPMALPLPEPTGPVENTGTLLEETTGPLPSHSGTLELPDPDTASHTGPRSLDASGTLPSSFRSQAADPPTRDLVMDDMPSVTASSPLASTEEYLRGGSEPARRSDTTRPEPLGARGAVQPVPSRNAVSQEDTQVRHVGKTVEIKEQTAFVRSDPVTRTLELDPDTGDTNESMWSEVPTSPAKPAPKAEQTTFTPQRPASRPEPARVSVPPTPPRSVPPQPSGKGQEPTRPAGTSASEYVRPDPPKVPEPTVSQHQRMELKTPPPSREAPKSDPGPKRDPWGQSTPQREPMTDTVEVKEKARAASAPPPPVDEDEEEEASGSTSTGAIITVIGGVLVAATIVMMCAGAGGLVAYVASQSTVASVAVPVEAAPDAVEVASAEPAPGAGATDAVPVAAAEPPPGAGEPPVAAAEPPSDPARGGEPPAEPPPGRGDPPEAGARTPAPPPSSTARTSGSSGSSSGGARARVTPPAPPPVVATRQQPAETYTAMASVAPPPTATMSTSAVPSSELDRWSKEAFAGELSPAAVSQLSSLTTADPAYTRGYTLLYLDAKARGDNRGRDKYLEAMMGLAENKYNPVLLVETAQRAIEKQDWDRALRDAQTAERHWARLPSDLVFSRKAMIYEIEALAQTAMFYETDGENLELLDQAIRAWDRYRAHAQTKARQDLLARADERLKTLHEIQGRLE